MPCPPSLEKGGDIAQGKPDQRVPFFAEENRRDSTIPKSPPDGRRVTMPRRRQFMKGDEFLQHNSVGRRRSLTSHPKTSATPEPEVEVAQPYPRPGVVTLEGDKKKRTARTYSVRTARISCDLLASAPTTPAEPRDRTRGFLAVLAVPLWKRGASVAGPATRCQPRACREAV